MKKQKIENKSNKSDLDIKGLIKVVCVLVVILGIIYGLTVGAQKLGWFDTGYVKPEVSNPVISYENILAGTMFDRTEDEYYVLITDFDSEKSVYVSSLGSLYTAKEDRLPLYAVNLGNGMNKSIIGEESNPSAQTATDLSVNVATLVKIVNGKNVKYIEGEENIKTELGV